MRLPSVRRVLLSVFALLVLCWIIWSVAVWPSNDREWSPDQAVLPVTDLNGDTVTVHNVRNALYRSVTDYDLRYEDRTYDLKKIKRAWYVVEPFNGFPGSAHTFLTFEFEGPEYVGISVEIRKEKGEKFSAWKGLFRKYELMYVVGDERDLIKLRTNFRKDRVMLYPLRFTKEQTRAMFVDMLYRGNTLAQRPEFYHTITNTCTTNIRDHAKFLSVAHIPFSWKLVLPEYSDELFQQLGLLNTNLPLEKARTHFLINDRAMQYADAEDFSVKIREGLLP